MAVIREGFKYRHCDWDLGSYMLIQKIEGNIAHCQYVSEEGPGFKESYLISGFSDEWVVVIDMQEELELL